MNNSCNRALGRSTRYWKCWWLDAIARNIAEAESEIKVLERKVGDAQLAVLNARQYLNEIDGGRS